MLDAVLDDVTPGRYVAGDLDGLAYHRLNEDYRPLHRLCRLFLEGASLSEDSGTFGFDAFLLDMNRLFEAFVTRALQERLPFPLVLHAQSVIRLDRAGEVTMRPDLVLRRADRVVVVADCKYKRLAPGAHRHHDLYQVLAYCTALGVPAGLLVYPRHLVPIERVVAIRKAKITIWEATIDLGGDQETLGAECARLATLLRELGSDPVA